MAPKRAADLKRGDVVDMPGEKRVVDHTEFAGLLSNNTTAVRVFWANYPQVSVLAADKEVAVIISNGEED